MSREAYERMTKRIIEHTRKNGGNISEDKARKIAGDIAQRHDQKNGK